MNKAQLIDALAPSFGGSKTKAAQVVAVVLEGIADILVSGDKVAVSGFGTFEPVGRAPRAMRLPSTGEVIRTKPSVGLRFVPSALLKQRMTDVANGTAPKPLIGAAKPVEQVVDVEPGAASSELAALRSSRKGAGVLQASPAKDKPASSTKDKSGKAGKGPKAKPGSGKAERAKEKSGKSEKSKKPKKL